MPSGYPKIPIPPVEVRFWAKVDKQFLGCWNWVGPYGGGGYGTFGSWQNGTRMVHRISYEMMVGRIPDGLQLDHLCRNRKCVNPDHLEPVTQRENLIRGETGAAANVKKTHCLRGHALTPGNLRVAALRRRKRECIICYDMRKERYGNQSVE